MLGKLIKHEWKAVGKTLGIMHIALILMAVVGKILLSIDVLKEVGSLWACLLFIYVISVMAVGIGTHIYLAMRFYKNMYTDEGYLSFTLPVKPWEHIVSKTLVSSMWILIDGIAILLSILILMMYQGMGTEFMTVLNQIWSELTAEGMNAVWFIVNMLVLLIAGLISPPLTYYFSISIGQLFNSHKLLASVVAYFVTINVLQVVSTIVSAAFLMRSLKLTEEEMAMQFSPVGTMYNTAMSSGAIGSLIVCAVFWFVINYIMNKRLNLE